MSGSNDPMEEARRRIAEAAINLETTISLAGLAIAAIPGEISQVRHLRSFDCSNTQVADLTPIAKLPALQSLDCSFTQITDLTPIAGLTTLQSLDCSGTPIADLTPIAGLTALQSLNCTLTQVADLTPVAGLTALQSLDCTFTQVADLTPVAGLTTLQSLDCGGTPIADLTPIAGLTALKSVACTNTQVTDLTPIAGLTALQFLACIGTPIADLTPIARLTALESLDCSDTEVADLTPIAGLTTLLSLSCWNTQVANLTPIAGLTTLKTLSCQGTQVADLTPITRLTALLSLDCRRTHIADLTPIAGLTTLRYLDCRDTQVADLTPIAGLTALERADFQGCKIVTLPTALGRLRSLEKGTGTVTELDRDYYGLWLKGNPLADPLPALIAPGQPEATRNVLAWLRGELVLDSPNAPPPQAAPSTDIPDIPPQGAGAHVVLDETGAIAFAPPADIDAAGNHVRRIRSMHPGIRDLALSLRARLSQGNRPYPNLLKRVETYCDIVDKPVESLDFQAAYDAGVRLENAAAAAERAILAKDLPAFDAGTDEELASLRELHGVWIAASQAGQECLMAAAQYALSSEEQAAFRAAIREWSDSLAREPQLVRPEVAAAMQDNLNEAGAKPHPERSNLLAGGLARNVAITVVTAGLGAAATAVALAALGPPGAVVGAPAALLAIEALKKSKPFSAVLSTLVPYLDKAATDPGPEAPAALSAHRDLALRNERILRRVGRATKSAAFFDAALDRLQQPLPRPEGSPAPAGPSQQRGPQWYVSYAWGDDKSASGRAREKSVDDACAAAEARGTPINRDKNALRPGDSIEQFMRRIGEGDRIFVFLSDKYLRSPFCMFELSEVWRNCRQDPATLRRRVRLWTVEPTDIWTPQGRATYARFWREQHESLAQHVRDLGGRDLLAWERMRRFHTEVGDILATFADTVQARSFDAFLEYGFSDPPAP